MTPAFVVRFLARLLFTPSRRRMREAVTDPEGAQRALLLDLVKKNAATIFGREHGFAEITSIDEFRRRVPIRTYDQLEPYLTRMTDGEWRILTMEAPTFFGRTSGTTGAAKLVPVTASYREEVRRSRRFWYYRVAHTFPKVLRGAILSVRSPKIEGKTRGGIAYGSVTVGLSQQNDGASRVAEQFEQIPTSIHLIDDFEARYYVLLRHALSLPISMITAINPSTVVLLCRKLEQHADRLATDVEAGTLSAEYGPERVPAALRAELERRWKPDPKMAKRIRASKARHGYVRPIDLWPRLAGIITWKAGPAGFYLQQLPRWFGDLPVMCWGFVATEGAFSIPVDAKSDDGVLSVMGHFMEFVEESAWENGVRDTVLAHELEVGKKYRIIITGAHGLYRYDMNDVVEVTGFYERTPRVRFSHKSGTIVSITGEKLTEHQVGRAIASASMETGVELVGFTLALRLGDPPGYVLAVEPKDASLDATKLEAFRAAADRALGEANIEYAGKRSSERLAPVRLLTVAPGAFDAERARRVREGSADAHVKIPYLQPSEVIVSRLPAVREVSP
ncbi:GH3 auxin-responsive promoter family protein [Myxococcota bacterium]|nr:GH3 auxin-responsive promoter family protein [Myxococcota bacterium]